MNETITIVRAVQTCYACPSQWDAWDDRGRYWYLRYRHGHGTAEHQRSDDYTTWDPKAPDISFAHGDPLDGVISLEEFCQLAGITLRLRHA